MTDQKSIAQYTATDRRGTDDNRRWNKGICSFMNSEQRKDGREWGSSHAWDTAAPANLFSLSLSDIRTVLIIYFGLVLHTTQGFRRAEELKRELLNKYSEEYQIYLTEKVSVRRSMEIGDTSVCSQDCPVLSQWSVLFNKRAPHEMCTWTKHTYTHTHWSGKLRRLSPSFTENSKWLR